MTRPLLMIALLLAILAAVFLLVPGLGGGSAPLYLIVGAVVFAIVGAITGK